LECFREGARRGKYIEEVRFEKGFEKRGKERRDWVVLSSPGAQRMSIEA
jgi:hypothetical protein